MIPPTYQNTADRKTCQLQIETFIFSEEKDFSMEPTLVIIGGGVAGLAAGCYAQINGLSSTVYEMHSIPGGLCTAWKRKDFTFDLCIHWLIGSKPGTSLHRLWEDLGIVQGRQFLTSDCWTEVRDQDGHQLSLYNDPDRLKTELLEKFASDKKFINSFIKGYRKFVGVDIAVDHSLTVLMKGIPFILAMKKYAMPVSELAKDIKDPLFRQLFTAGMDWHDQSAAFTMMGMGIQASGDGGYPVGGSLPFVKALESRYISLGGTIHYQSRVTSVITERDRAVGIVLEDGTEKRADAVISAADGHTTIFNWLKGVYIDEKIEGYYRDFAPFPPLVFVSLGVNATFADEPLQMTLILKDPVTIGGVSQTSITIRNHSRDQTFAPPGKCTLTLMISSDIDYWSSFDRHSQEYRAEKEKVADTVIDLVSLRLPGIREKIEMIDVATPLTFVRYTGNWKGSYEGWLMNQKSILHQMPFTLPGLSRFYMAGQWVMPGGGLPSSALSAQSAIKQLCKDLGRPFSTQSKTSK
jgi:phytoene dehydrogenase-like protein